MRSFLAILLLCVISLAQENVVDIICPLPGNPDPSTVMEDQCNQYTACEYTSDTCHMKSNEESGYLLASEPMYNDTGIHLSLKKANTENTLFGADIEEVVVDILYHHNYHFEIKINDGANSRYEVPIQRNIPDAPGTDPVYEVTTATEVDEPFFIEVTRKSTGTVVFRTEGPLTFEDQFLQVTSSLSSPYFYGIGEICHSSLLRSFDQRTTSALFNRDRPPYPGSNDNLYGTHPYYINIEDDDGNTHSVFLDNSNSIEYSTFLLGNSPAVTIRTIGGILDFHIFLGPTPDDITVQYTEFIGRPFLPPYWSLGFQLSRNGYGSLDNYKVVHDRMVDAEIPWDTQYFDIEYMVGNRDFTYDKTNFANLPNVSSQLHSENKKLVLIFDSAIAIDFDTYPPSQRGKDNDVYIKWSNESYIPDGQPDTAADYVLGNVWPSNNIVFPDFLNPAAVQWWGDEINIFHESVEFDGVWIDMNEPSNFGTNTGDNFQDTGINPLQCPDNNLERPPYGTLVASIASTNSLSDATLCMSSSQTDGNTQYLHYDVHNLYGYTEGVATYKGLTDTVFPGERPFIVSRSSFAGSGQYVAHWLGDNKSAWEDLKASLIGIVEFSFFGISTIGADVCGFINDSNEELCARWMQTGAFYALDRNHNNAGSTDQDPARPDWPSVTTAGKAALTVRYKYLPFLYTSLHRAHMFGNAAIRPYFTVFPSDLDARSIDDAFFWSDKLLVAPVVDQGATSKDVYFPDSLWYDLLDGTLVTQGPITLTVDAPIEKIPLYVRGGSILPFQEPSLNTVESRQNPFGLTIALDSNNKADGELYWDDGHTEHTMDEAYLGTFTYDQGTLSLTIQYNPDIASDLVLSSINIYGYPSNPTGIDVNGEAADSSSWSYNESKSVLSFSPSINLGQEFTVVFS